MALRKNSYVKTERHFQVGLEMLRPYRKDGEQDFKLSRESFDVLVKYIKFTPPPPRASQRTQITGYPPPHAPSPSTAASRATPPRRTRTYPNIADLPYSSPSAASPGLPVSYSRTDEWTTRTRHPPDSLPYDERSRLISSNVSAPEGDSLPPICKGFLFVVVASVLCAGVYFAPKIGPSVKAYLGL
ncbi:MAG: hypothetical protein M1839_009346 [Geoglossum umbratile]|nr:MAG: hypothetical protein M1839_009346 [Geoglossum umbratile]